MIRFLSAAALILLAACAPQPKVPMELQGRWDVQQVAGASLGQGVSIWMEIDARTGEISGFTGCKPFTSSLDGFANRVVIAPVSEGVGECSSPAAATDEARFLGVLPGVQRYILHGRSLELLPALPGAEALLLLRREPQ